MISLDDRGCKERENWLRVLGTAELPHIGQGVRQQFHAKVSLLQVFKTKQHSFEFVLPRKGPIDPRPQCMGDVLDLDFHCSACHADALFEGGLPWYLCQFPVPIVRVSR
jgi:hypothetical protein